MTVTPWDVVNTVGISVGAGAFLFVGRKLQVLDQITKTMEKVKGNLKLVTDHLITTQAGPAAFDHEKLQSYSPTQITEKGMEYLREIGFINVFEAQQKDFFDCIDAEEPTADYDIQNAAIRCVFYLFDKPYFSGIKEYFYQNPRDESRPVFAQIAGIYVRDKYMEYKGKRTDVSNN